MPQHIDAMPPDFVLALSGMSHGYYRLFMKRKVNPKDAAKVARLSRQLEELYLELKTKAGEEA